MFICSLLLQDFLQTLFKLFSTLGTLCLTLCHDRYTNKHIYNNYFAVYIIFLAKRRSRHNYSRRVTNLLCFPLSVKICLLIILFLLFAAFALTLIAAHMDMDEREQKAFQCICVIYRSRWLCVLVLVYVFVLTTDKVLKAFFYFSMCD